MNEADAGHGAQKHGLDGQTAEKPRSTGRGLVKGGHVVDACKGTEKGGYADENAQAHDPFIKPDAEFLQCWGRQQRTQDDEDEQAVA